ncbi:MAG TPA: hypothetical protein PLG22_17330 [Kiritimatiellia bacterium]|nr:hypothetical protein [Kiritimatiellia bacterium]
MTTTALKVKPDVGVAVNRLLTLVAASAIAVLLPSAVSGETVSAYSGNAISLDSRLNERDCGVSAAFDSRLNVAEWSENGTDLNSYKIGGTIIIIK